MKILLIVYIYLFLQMCMVWLSYRLLKNPSVVDVSWSLGLMMAGLIYLLSQPDNLRLYVISGLLIAWGLRLAGYLWYSRIRLGHVDKRYTKISDSWKISQSLGFFLNFQLQALLIFVVSSVFFWVSKTPAADFSHLDAVACLLVVAGIIGESTADWQLQRFKASNKGKVCAVGLWAYSRHPNYFFDWLTWCGFAVFALRAEWGCIGLISPLLMYLIFTRVTGPITERGSLESRGNAFVDYQARTSMFFPWFRR